MTQMTTNPLLIQARLSRWVDGSIEPVRVGMYQMQDVHMNCDCCWIDAYWNGKKWLGQLHSQPYFRTLILPGNIKRWRGLAEQYVE